MPSFSKGERVDRALVRQGWVASRHRAQELVQAGRVWTTGTDGRALRIDKPSRRLALGVRLHCGEPQSRDETATVWRPMVSRGYLKLAHGLRFFGLSPRGAIALDIGAGTGGFSECLLHSGVRRVYAVDVGRNQLHPALRGHAGLRVLEGLDARRLSRAHIPDLIDWLVCDVSFISATKVLEPALELTGPGAVLVLLVKPQFEQTAPVTITPSSADRLAAEACDKLRRFLARQAPPQDHWRVRGVCESPVRGARGHNKEFLLCATKTPQHGLP